MSLFKHDRRFLWGTLLSTLLFIAGCVAPIAPTTDAPVAEVATTEATTSTETATSSRFPLTITDAAGQEFTFDTPPNIGCIWYGCMEAMADLGVPPYAASFTEEIGSSVFLYPAGPPANNIEDTNNPELWAATETDIIITRVPVAPDMDALNAAVPIFYLHHPSYGESSSTGYQAFIENLKILGQLIDNPEAADVAIARFDTVLANLNALSTPELAEAQVAVLFSGEGYSGIAPSNPFCVALGEVGLGKCVEAAEGDAWLDVNAEQFLTIDPDWIVYMGEGETGYQTRTDPVWSQLTAVKEGRVFDAAGGRYYCCSTRGLIHALQDYASHVLPEANLPVPATWLEFDPLQSPLVAEPASQQ